MRAKRGMMLMGWLFVWVLRLAIVVAAAGVANYVLYTGDVSAGHANRFALVRESSWGSYTGAQGDMWFGNPTPDAPNPGFSNGTFWAGNDDDCGGNSWVETGWYEGYKNGNFGRYYKFIYRVPGTNNCNYTEAYIGGVPDYNDIENFRLERCLSCGGTEWRWYWQGLHTASVQTGWANAASLDAGGEVGGHQAPIGMQGAILNMKYRRASSSSWYTWSETITDWAYCSSGYALFWIGTDDIFFANSGGGCG